MEDDIFGPDFKMAYRGVRIRRCKKGPNILGGGLAPDTLFRKIVKGRMSRTKDSGSSWGLIKYGTSKCSSPGDIPVMSGNIDLVSSAH